MSDLLFACYFMKNIICTLLHFRIFLKKNHDIVDPLEKLSPLKCLTNTVSKLIENGYLLFDKLHINDTSKNTYMHLMKM